VPSLSTLRHDFRPYAEACLKAARTLDARFTITSAKRSRTDQQRLYNRYLKGESPFPALPPGRSQHEKGLAFDMVRLNVDPEDDDLLREVGAAWRAAGGVYGGDVDPVHFEAPKSWTGRA